MVTPLTYHLCSLEELGLERSNAQFYTVSEDLKIGDDNEMFLFCLDDPTSIEIFGDFQTNGFKQLNIDYNLCTPQKLDDLQEATESSTICKSEEDLRKVD